MYKIGSPVVASNGRVTNRVHQYLPDPPLADPISEERVADLRARLYALIERGIEAGIEAGLEARLNGLGQYGPKWIAHCVPCGSTIFRQRSRPELTACTCGSSLLWAEVVR